MKKILLATSALVASAGFASAGVDLSGSARFGIQGMSAGGTSTWGLEKRFTLNIDASGEADNGWTYGGRVRIRDDEYDGGAMLSGANVYVAAGGFKITVGNIAGAIEVMPGLYNNSVGLTGLGYLNLATNTVWAGSWGWDSFASQGQGGPFAGTAAEGVALSYSAGDFTVNASRSWFTNTGGAFCGAAAVCNNNTALSASYNIADWTVALGHQTNGSIGGRKTVGIVSGSFGDFGVTAQYASNQIVANFNSNKIVLGGNYAFGATTVTGYIANENAPAPLPSITTVGLGVSHDLGGITLVGGVVNQSGGGTSITNYDLGLKVSF